MRASTLYKSKLLKKPMTSLTTSIKPFTTLNRAPCAIWTDATKRKAPHKLLLLLAVLAVLDLVHRGVTTSPFIAVSGDVAMRRLSRF